MPKVIYVELKESRVRGGVEREKEGGGGMRREQEAGGGEEGAHTNLISSILCGHTGLFE